MSHDSWWSEEFIPNIEAEIFNPINPPTPRTSLISSQDPLDVIKSDEFVIQNFRQDSGTREEQPCVFLIDFREPISATESATVVCQDVLKDIKLIRSSEETVLSLIGQCFKYFYLNSGQRSHRNSLIHSLMM